MRTAGKRPKALLARRMRPRDSRFVPSLTDRPPQFRQMPPRPVPPALPPASIQAACGDFQEPLPATPVCCRYKKIFFGPLWQKIFPGTLPAIPRPARATHARQQPPFFPNRQDPADTATSLRVALPAFSLYRRAGRIPPPRRPIHTTARITPGHRCQRQVCSKKTALLRSIGATGPTPPIPRWATSPDAGTIVPQDARRPYAPLSPTRTKVFTGMGVRGKGRLFQKASLPPQQPHLSFT